MKFFYSILYGLVWLFFQLTHPYRIITQENIPIEGGAILCSNHTFASDPLYIILAFKLKFPLRVLAKKEIKSWPLIGFVLDRLGLIWVKRGENDLSALKQSRKALLNGEKMIIFPEGTRKADPSQAKNGAVILAKMSQAVIVPIYLPKQKRWFHSLPVVIGQAYSPLTEIDKPTAEDYERATHELMEKIAKLKSLI